MEKEFVPYELAFRMKQLGFDEPCFSYYMNGVLQPSLNPKDYSYFNEMSEINPNIKNFENVLAPLYRQAFRWFREQKGMWVTFEYYDCDCVEADVCWYVGKCFIYGIGPLFLTNELGDFKTLEEAEAACLEALIEIVEKKRKIK